MDEIRCQRDKNKKADKEILSAFLSVSIKDVNAPLFTFYMPFSAFFGHKVWIANAMRFFFSNL